MDPVSQLASDRAAARGNNDPCANLCTTASVDDNGFPQARTLVLRELEGRFAVFGNETSPKWQQISADSPIAVVVWLPSLNLQYRLECLTESIPQNIVHDSWSLRPDPPKRMDWYYTNHQSQGSPVPDRQSLLRDLQALSLPDPLVAPATAMGLYLIPRVVDRLDLNQPDGVHDRRRFELVDGGWVQTILVP
jgi:pyridoxine/pyridoxamine 5'-phosphate oxidase